MTINIYEFPEYKKHLDHPCLKTHSDGSLNGSLEVGNQIIHLRKKHPKIPAWRALSNIENFERAPVIEWLSSFGGYLETRLFSMSKKELTEIWSLLNIGRVELPSHLSDLEEWFEPNEKGGRLELDKFVNDGSTYRPCPSGESHWVETQKWMNRVELLWGICRDVAKGNIPSEEDWKTLRELEHDFISRPRRTHRTRTDEEANFARHIFYIDDPHDVIEEEQAARWVKTQWLIESTYRSKPHSALSRKRGTHSSEIKLLCDLTGYLKMAKIEDIVHEAVLEDPKSPLRNLIDYELAEVEFEWVDCPKRLPEKGEIQGPGGDLKDPNKVGIDECFVLANGNFYRIYDNAYFEAEYKRRNYDRYAPPDRCLDLLRDVYDEEFFDYIRRFRRKVGMPGSLIAGKPLEYPEDYRPEFSSEFCYFGRKPRFCLMQPCPVFSNEKYSFNREHTKAFHKDWNKAGHRLWQ